MDEVESNAWLEEQLQALDLTGRDALYTYLLQQEIPMFLGDIYAGKLVEDVQWLIDRRGFNTSEIEKLHALVKFLNKNAKRIRKTEPAIHKHCRYMRGFEEGIKSYPRYNGCDPVYSAGVEAGRKAYNTACMNYARKLGINVMPKMRAPYKHAACKEKEAE